MNTSSLSSSISHSLKRISTISSPLSFLRPLSVVPSLRPTLISLSTIVSLSLISVSGVHAAVPTGTPTGATAGGLFRQYFTNIIGTAPCAPNTILKSFDTTPGSSYGTRQCVALPITSIKDALSGFDSTTGAPVYMNAWLKSGTNVYYNGGNIGIGTSTPTDKLDVVGNIKASGNISTPATTVLTSGKIQVLDIVTENTACTPNGLIARDTTGLLLSCQSGLWKKASGGGGKILQSEIVTTFANSRTVNFCLAGYAVCGYFFVDGSGNLYSYRIAWINGHTDYFPASYMGNKYFMNLNTTTDFNDSMGGGCGDCKTHISVSNIGVTVSTSKSSWMGPPVATSKTFFWLY